jgi:hypothetical protein
MPTVPVTSDQLDQLKAKVQKLSDDTSSANQATQAANDAQAALTKAQADSAAANTAEAVADGVVSSDLTDLQSFVQGLAAAPPTPPQS